MKEYTHKERAVNFAMDFASITNDSIVTNVAKQSAIVALRRTVENMQLIVQQLFDNGHEDFGRHLMIILNDEKSMLAEVECL